MVRVGLVGCGFMGAMHANVYGVLNGAELVGVFDKSALRAKEFAAKWGCGVYSSFQEMLADDVSLVDVCLPTNVHAEYTVNAASLGDPGNAHEP